MPKALASLLLALATTACFAVRHTYQGDKFLTADATPDGAPVTKVRQFRAHDRQFFWLHGGIPVGKDLNGAELAAAEAGPHDGVVNLRLSDGQDFADMAITHVFCVLSILCGTWSVWAEGDVVDVEEMP
jgi:hypothetical protein